MKLRALLTEAAYWGLGAVLLGALVHFVVLLAIPRLADRDAYARLEPMGAVWTTFPLPRVEPGDKGFPYEDPAIASAICRFDLSSGPVRVRAPLGRAGFASLSFHSRHGQVFYALTDRAATKGTMEALVVTRSQLRVLEAHDDEDNPSEDLRIVSPTDEGFVRQRVLSELPDLYPNAKTQAVGLTCGPEPPGEALR
jgi:uncharacterized membrane protein